MINQSLEKTPDVGREISSLGEAKPHKLIFCIYYDVMDTKNKFGKFCFAQTRDLASDMKSKTITASLMKPSFKDLLVRNTLEIFFKKPGHLEKAWVESLKADESIGNRLLS